MLMRSVCSAGLLLLASGCSTMPCVAPTAAAPIPATLLLPCPPLFPLLEGTFPEVSANLVRSAGMYYECKSRHADLIEAIKKRQP